MIWLIIWLIRLASENRTSQYYDRRNPDFHDRYRRNFDSRLVKPPSGPNVPLIILLTILGIGGLGVLGVFGICLIGALNAPRNAPLGWTPPVSTPAGSTHLSLAQIQLPTPQTTNRPVAMRRYDVQDLTVTELRGTSAPCLCWNDAGTSYYTLDNSKGVVTRVALAGFKEERRLETGHQCTWLSMSLSGLLLTVADLGEVWVLDEETLAVTDRVALPGAVRVVSAPESPTAFGLCDDGSLWIVDLAEMQRLVHFLPTPTRGLQRPVITADGKYLFCTNANGGSIHRFAVIGQELVFEESSADRPGDEASAPCPSADGKFVCLPSGRGDKPVAEGPTTTVFPADNLKAPAFFVDTGEPVTAVGFDAKAGKVYAANGTGSLLVFNQAGVQDKKYAKVTGPKPVLQYLVHPEGRKMLVVAEDKMVFVEWSRR